MAINYHRVPIRKETFTKIKTAISICLEENPDYEKFKITQDFIIDRVLEYYIMKGKLR